ncbi:prolyl oligopeptidase family serine peptidase [Nocardiopsis algeriensis]|uniref:prolyl oligopeptidase n=1 Tax=Nocardiopsis algeriensis TaxID=1478215 RepID=A0A841IS46_9ACTN|nr:prolyl oligopeptidase family serine peptidase [Nocardiopsis algeriensis]MBB6119028.1 prolyl oligopeptidase [Nocardiopsis algeriensis]
MPELRYPSAERLDLVENLHGHAVADPYRWLEDAGSARTKEWSAAQDTLYAEASARYRGRERFADRIRALMGAGAVGAPVWRGERRFFGRRTAEQEHAVLYVQDGDGPERPLIDPGAIDPEGLTTLDAWKVDPSGRLLAYQLSEGGSEESVLRVMDVDTGETVDGPVDRARYSPVAWLPDSSAFYYVRRLPPEEVPEGEEDYHRRVYLHRLGSPADQDVLVFGEGRDKTEYFDVSVSRDGRRLILSASKGTSPATDLWIADLAEGDPGAPRLVPVQEGVDAYLSAHVGRDGRMYLMTDRDAPRGRLCVADPDSPQEWTTLLPEDPGAVLEDYALLDGPGMERPELLAVWSRHAVSEISRHDMATGERLGMLEMPGLGSSGPLMERPEGGHEAWFGYTDSTHPSSVYRYDATSGEVSLWAAAPGDVDLPGVRVEQVAFTSRDGTEVRMLVMAPEEPADGPRPTILYGYGGFRISLTPGYSATALAWVRAGGVYAVANLRGGLEEGEEWHRAGMLADKQNVFDDCAAAAEHLVATGVTDPEHLAVMGGSNGGLLVGAMVTQRPDLFAAAVCSAPLLDMVRYERFGLGQLWNVEYGSADDPEQLGWLLGYSPYHNVDKGTRYPATLFTVFDNDTRVDPLHARKLCALMQWATGAPADDRPILLRREAEVGHSARSVSRSVALNAEQLAFLAHHLGLSAD